MATKTKTLKLMKPYGIHPAGKVVVFPASVADPLVRRGVAMEVMDETKKPARKKREGWN